MADFIIKAGLINAAHRILNGQIGGDPGVLPLLGPATPKGRYALTRAADAVAAAAFAYNKQHVAQLEIHAKKDGDGRAITQSLETPQGRVTQYDFGAGFGVTTPEFEAAMAELNDEDITLPGVRQTLMAELKDAPLTGVHLSVLIKCGLLEDKEPE